MKYSIYVGTLVLLVTASVGFFSYRYYNAKLISERNKYENEINAQAIVIDQYETKSKKGWILNKDLEAGDTISDVDIQETMLPDYFSPENVISEKDELVGKVIKINALASTAITEEMVFDDGALEPSERKEEVQYVRLPLKIQSDETVDIRIVFPNGEDYIVVAKKKLQDVDVENQNAFFQSTEEEALLLQSALVDAYIKDAELYMKQYVEPELQPKPQVTYTPNQDVLDLMAQNPQIVDQAKWKLRDTVRANLDDRLNLIESTDKVRVGAGAPMGSAVAKRKQNDGAVYYNETENPANSSGTGLGVNGIIDAPAAGVDSSQSAKANESEVYPVPESEDVPDVNAPNMLGGEE